MRPSVATPEIVHDIHVKRARPHLAGGARREGRRARRRAAAHRLCRPGGRDEGPVRLGGGARERRRGAGRLPGGLARRRRRIARRCSAASSAPACGPGRDARLRGRSRAVLAALRAAHLFLFCHQTPESPRCLIEALVSGCPIVGYDSAFPRDLVSTHQGRLRAAGRRRRARRDCDAPRRGPAALADLIRRAAADGAPFEDVAVFRHRSALIKAHLGGRP